MKTKFILSVTTVLALTACQTTMPLQTNPETIVYNSSVKKVRNAVANACVNRQLFVESQTDNSVVCSQEAGSLAQVWFGTKYGSGVSAKAQFNIIEVQDKAIKVVGRGWFENQNAYGGIKRNYMDNGQMPQQIQTILDDVKQNAEK